MWSIGNEIRLKTNPIPCPGNFPKAEIVFACAVKKHPL
jgi:hypothetical protein